MFLSERCKHASQSKAPVHCKVLYAVLACNAKCNFGSRMRQLQPSAKKLFFANQMNTRAGTLQAGGGERGDGEVDGCGEIPALVGHAEPDASAYPNQPGRKHVPPSSAFALEQTRRCKRRTNKAHAMERP